MTEAIDYTKFDFARDVNFKVSEAIRSAPSDPEKAAEVLLLAAEYMRSGQPMPKELVDYVAGAFHAAMLKPVQYRVRALALELNLEASGRRPSEFDWMHALTIIENNPTLSRPELITLIMKQGECGRTHARGLLKKALEARDQNDKLTQQEKMADG